MMNNSSSWIHSTPQVNVLHALETSPGLGLKLTVTPPFLDKLYQLQLAQTQNCYNTGEPSNTSFVQQHANKIKAENFPISLLRIGSWQRVSRNEGDLVAKCYFAKRKLVWEFLENGLKSKIEIQWSDILSLRAVMLEDQHGILEIELNQAPTFHHEIDPQPRKHTQWRMVPDFTGGQAPTFRRHYLEFPYGALNKPLEKLLRCDNRLFQLSRQRFPTLESPYFEKPTYFSMDFGGQGYVNPAQQHQQQQQFSFSNVPAHYLVQQTYEQKAQKSLSFNDSKSPISDEQTSNQIGGMPLSAAAAAASVPQVNNPMPGYGQEHIFVQNNHIPPGYAPDPISSFQEAERQLQNLLLNNSRTEFSNWTVEDGLSREGFYTNNASNAMTNSGQNVVDSVRVMSNNLSSNAGTLKYPQAAAAAASSSWQQSQIPDENMHMNMLLGNNTLYPSVNFDPPMGYFSNFNDWK